MSLSDNSARLLRAIGASSHAMDDELAQRTGIQPRQQVNQILRRLEDKGVVRRRHGPSGKLVTELVAVPDSDFPGATEVAAAPLAPQAGPSRVSIERAADHTQPPGDSGEQREAERIMLDLLGQTLGRDLEPATIRLDNGTRVEIDGADPARSVLVECWAHQGPPKGGQKHKVLTDALKLIWIARTIYPRPELVLCMSDAQAASHFRPGSRSWAAQALQDLGVQVRLVELPDDVRRAVQSAQTRQSR